MSDLLSVIATEPQQRNKPKNSKPWYRDGLPFSCTQCGQCCTGSPGYAWVSEQEITAIADHLGITTAEFKTIHARQVGFRYALKERPVTYDCVFLNDNKCSIYSVRPKQCQTFPWWPENVESPEAWKAAGRHCEGIRDAVEIVPYEKIQQQLKEP